MKFEIVLIWTGENKSEVEQFVSGNEYASDYHFDEEDGSARFFRNERRKSDPPQQYIPGQQLSFENTSHRIDLYPGDAVIVNERGEPAQLTRIWLKQNNSWLAAEATTCKEDS
jgi:hypothetical protein